MDKLTFLRHQIDKIDLQILKDLKRRFQITGTVQKWKKKHGMPHFQKNREAQILKRLEKACKKMGLSPRMIDRIYKSLFQESRKGRF